VAVDLGLWVERHSLLDWIKEGPMAVFFFAVGLEIKFEVLKGELSTPRKLALPVLAALGGMAVPALIYTALNLGVVGGQPGGWPIPVATDIVFALAALAAVGARAPPALRAFLLALAVADDLGAVLLIAVLFTGGLAAPMLAGASATLGVMTVLGYWRRAPVLLYVLGAVVVWGFTLKSGVSTSVGAVAAALTVPLGDREGRPCLVHAMAEALRPWVTFLVLPVFAFSASGFALGALTSSDLVSPVAVGVFAGLLVGKPVGVLGASLLAVGLGLAHRPAGASWTQVAAASLLCGVGFTMSLYLAGLAFAEGSPASSAARLGVILGSVAATAAGVALLRRP
jgi:NhaA family Na+:H+ antiporter